jgi:hypothetical protein
MRTCDGKGPISPLSLEGFSAAFPFFRRSGGTLLGLLLAICMFYPLGARAQVLTATLSGVVTDSSGAVIPNATITVTEDGVAGVSRTVHSDATGNYSITNLAAGTYTVTITAAGFEGFKAQHVVLNVAQKRGLNAVLKVGSASTTVTVNASAVAVNTQSAAEAGTLTGKQIHELELAGRNFQELVTLQPGVVNQMGDETSAGNTAMSVNGARTSANNWTIDGADINDTGSNTTVTNSPNVDAIQEFTLERGTYDAGYGRSGGGQVLVQTKAGTSQFHGDAYEYVRNTILDANEWFNKRSQIENGLPNKNPVNHHNVYGFTIGGPVFIPRLYNTSRKRTYFFWAEEWRKTSTPGGDTMPAASKAELQGIVPGDFTNAPANCTTYDPASNTTKISPQCYSSNSKVYLTNVFDKYPANDGGNYTFSYSALNNYRDDIVRVDEYFTKKLHFFARYLNDTMPSDDPEGLWAGSNYPSLADTSYNSPGKNVVANLTWTISPKAVNEFEFAWSQGTIAANIKPGQFAISPQINSELTNQWTPDPYGKVPAISIIGVTGFNPGSSPYKERNLDRTFFDNLSLSLGKQTIRTGFQLQQMVKTENAVNGDPSFSFNSWGDFLVGNVASFTQTLPDIVPDLHFANLEAYIQDDWNITRRLTLNLGVRWSRFPSPMGVNNTLSNFDPAYFSPLFAPQIDGGDAATDSNAGNFIPGQSINGYALIPATYTNGLIFPKGAACARAQSIAPLSSCSPYNRYVNPNYNANFAPRLGFSYDVRGNGKTVIRGGLGIFYDRLLDGIWEQNAFNNPPLAQKVTILNGSFDNIKGGSNFINYGPNNITATGTPAFKVPNYANFNVSVQHMLLPNTVVEVAYVGNLARHLLGEVDLNQPTVAARETAPTNASVNYIRPYRGYAAIVSRVPIFTNNYNSLQISVNHQSHGLQLGMAYTYSKDMTTNSSDRSNVATDTYDLSLDYGPSTYNTPQIFTADYVYDLPFFRGQHGLKGRVLGGWEVSGITSFTSGSSISLIQPLGPWDQNGLNTGLGMGAAGIAPRPDQIAPVHMYKRVGEWFSTSSFATAVNHFGSERSGSMLGPGYDNWDLAAVKNIKLFDGDSFQLRGEFFNAFNHESFGSPGSVGSSNFDGVDVGTQDPSFGQVISGHSPRRIQLAAKFYF